MLALKVSEARVGRVFIVKFEHGEDLLDGLKKLAKEKNIQSASFQVFGALSEAAIVVGPEEDTVPPNPMWRTVDSACEIVGIGSILESDDGPSVHMHSSFSGKDSVQLGCVRKKSKVYLVVEAIVQELITIGVSRRYDESLGINAMEIEL